MVKKVEPMTTGSIWKRMVVFALPLLLGNLFQQLYNTVDSLIVGNFLGHTALAAVTSSGSLVFMLIGFFMGVATGAGVVISKYFGSKDNENVEKAVHSTVALGLVCSVVLTAVGMLFTPQILKWMDTPENVIPEACTYLTIYFSGSLGFVMYNVFVGILQAVGDSRHPLYYLIFSSVVNFFLDILFVGVLHTGVEGAAWATIIAQTISAILCMIQLMRTKECFRVQLRKIRFDKRVLIQIIKIGLPSGVQNSIIGFANVIVQANVNFFGDMAMAGYGAYAKIEGFVFLPITSFAMAITTFIGQNLGAGEIERARKGARFGVWVTIILAEIIGIILFIFAPFAIKAFDSTPEVIQFGVEKTRTAALFYFLLAFSHSIAAVYRGAGKAVVPMLVTMICWCVIRVAFLEIAIPLTNSIQTVYWVYPLTWFLSSAFFLIYLLKTKWFNVEKK